MKMVSTTSFSRTIRRWRWIPLLVTLTIASPGCGFVRSIWNAEAPKRKVVVLESKPMPEFSRIFSHDETDSRQTFEAWKENILSSFKQIEGNQKDYLSRAEIRTLVRSGLVKLDPNPEISAERALSVLEILGFKDGVGIADVSALIQWLDDHRREARAFYDLFINETFETDRIHAAQVTAVLNLFGSFASLLGDQDVNSEHLGELVLPWIPTAYPRARNALPSGIELGIAFFVSFCGDRVRPDVWNGNRIGRCLRSLTTEFSPVDAVVDFMFGNRSPTLEPEKLAGAAKNFELRVRNWIQGHHHPLFPVRKVAEFAKALSIPPPYAFLKMTEWMPKLNSDSTIEGFSPTFFIDLSGILRVWVESTVQAASTQPCATHESWKSCEFTGKFEPAEQLFNGEYATLIRTPTLGFVSKVALYHALSGFVFTRLDIEHEGELKSNIKDLIGIAIRLLDSNAFAQNVIAGILERPIDPSNMEDSLKSHTRLGLAELAALAADLIPSRDQNDRTLLRKLQSQILNREKRMPYSMDRIGLTAFIYLYDLVSSLNHDYLTRYELPVRAEGTLRFVKRRRIMEVFPTLLFDHFPRLYNECVKWGFERTCGVVFNEILPNASPGRDELETYEMDVITLSAVLIESMMGRCDRNSDDRLSGSPIDGYDEKTCMITIGTALAKRLMRAGFLDQDQHADFLMKLTNHFFIARWAAKAALARGTVKGIAWFAIPASNWLSGSANLGSVMSVAAELMDPKKVKAVEENLDGPIDSFGDELLYHNQLTDYYLPKLKEAPRYRRKMKTGESP